MLTRCFATPGILTLGAALLLGSAQAGWAAEVTPTPVSAATAQRRGADTLDPRFAPTPNSSAQDQCPTGVAGFGRD
jgi:hypothetical protein